MSTTAAVEAEALLTAEKFAERPDPGYPEELVRGKVVAMPPPRPRHGKICLKFGRILGDFVEAHDLGHMMSNDSGIITERGPDSVRGADLSFYSYAKLPKGDFPDVYPDSSPELVVEVVSPSDRWPKVLAKVAEYLNAGVLVVALVDYKRRSVQVFDAEGANPILTSDQELAFPTILPGFSVLVGKLFE